MDKVSYCLGIVYGQDVRAMSDGKIDYDDFIRGMKVSMSLDAQEEIRKNLEIPEEEIRRILIEHHNRLNEKKQRALEEERKRTLKEGMDYLKARSGEDGVRVTRSGLQYKALVEGDGKQPSPHSRVKCHYRGWFPDGTEFDSSYKRGEPAVFGLDQVIRGWAEGLQLMKVGSKYEFTIPSELGYGEVGIPGHIPGNSVLNFVVELLDVE